MHCNACKICRYLEFIGSHLIDVRSGSRHRFIPETELQEELISPGHQHFSPLFPELAILLKRDKQNVLFLLQEWEQTKLNYNCSVTFRSAKSDMQFQIVSSHGAAFRPTKWSHYATVQSNLVVVQLLQAFRQRWVASSVSPQMHCREQTSRCHCRPARGGGPSADPHPPLCGHWVRSVCSVRCKRCTVEGVIHAVASVRFSLYSRRRVHCNHHQSFSPPLTRLVLVSVPGVPASNHLTGVILVLVEPVLHLGPTGEAGGRGLSWEKKETTMCCSFPKKSELTLQPKRLMLC